MNKLCDKSITIYEALQNIKRGRYVMPAFQRQFVWGMAQIEKLWDSILLGYPIATFLFWHVDDDNITWDTNVCNFLTKVTFDSTKSPDSVNYGLSHINLKYSDTAVLDGQQRLTSLFLSLEGEAHIRSKHARKKNSSTTIEKLVIELDKNRLTVDEDEYNSKRYDVRFTDKIGMQRNTLFEIRNIMSDEFRNEATRAQAIENAIKYVSEDSKEYARDILKKLYSKIFEEKLIRYTEIYGMNQDAALEMFVRFNAGGKPLKKSDITMSILEAYWPSSKAEFGKLLVDSYEGFGTDFVIRSALMLYGDVVKSNINKQTADALKNNWDNFKRALRNLETALKEIKVDVSRFRTSWNVLLPILYTLYYNPDYQDSLDGIQAYLVRAVLFTYFRSGTTGKLNTLRSRINEYGSTITVDMLDSMNELKVTEGKIDDILNAERGSRIAGEALYFLSIDWWNKGISYEQDHLHPYEGFEKNNPIGVQPDTWRRWRSQRDRLPNLWLLGGRSNASKSDMRLLDFYNDMTADQQATFRKEAMIPIDASLELEDFEDFYEKRKALMAKKLKELMR